MSRRKEDAGAVTHLILPFVSRIARSPCRKHFVAAGKVIESVRFVIC